MLNFAIRIHLQSFGSTDGGVTGKADAENLNIYLRRRAPTGVEFCRAHCGAMCLRARALNILGPSVACSDLTRLILLASAWK